MVPLGFVIMRQKSICNEKQDQKCMNVIESREFRKYDIFGTPYLNMFVEGNF